MNETGIIMPTENNNWLNKPNGS